MKRILVTGHKGFIGSAMYDKLVDDGHYVIGYDIKDHDNDYDLEYLIQIIEASNIDTVMHFGALSSTTETDLNKVLYFNYDFTRELIDICYERDILLQISSSASVYGKRDDEIPFKETDEVDLLSPYALSKYLCERYALKKIYDHGARIQIFRYFNAYSYHSNESHKGNQASPFFKFYHELYWYKKIELFEGSESFKRDFIFYGDVINIQNKFLNIQEDGIWNIGSGQTSSFLDVARRVINSLNKSHESIVFIPMPENLKQHYQTYTCADLTKLNETLKRHGK